MTKQLHSTRGRRVAAALFFTTALSTVAVAPPAAAQSDQRAWNAFANSRYNYCDAKMIGALWGMNADGGKIQIGKKILNGIGDNIPLVLRESRNAGNSCDWEDTGYSYDDAVALSDVWGVDSWDAKMKIARYFTQGRSHIVRRALGY